MLNLAILMFGWRGPRAEPWLKDLKGTNSCVVVSSVNTMLVMFTYNNVF
jgi:hypothetical protein